MMRHNMSKVSPVEKTTSAYMDLPRITATRPRASNTYSDHVPRFCV